MASKIRADPHEQQGIPLGALLRMGYQGIVAHVHAHLADAGFDDVRPAHMTIFQHLLPEGSRNRNVAAFRIVVDAREPYTRLVTAHPDWDPLPALQRDGTFELMGGRDRQADLLAKRHEQGEGADTIDGGPKVVVTRTADLLCRQPIFSSQHRGHDVLDRVQPRRLVQIAAAEETLVTHGHPSTGQWLARPTR